MKGNQSKQAGRASPPARTGRTARETYHPRAEPAQHTTANTVEPAAEAPLPGALTELSQLLAHVEMNQDSLRMRLRRVLEAERGDDREAGSPGSLAQLEPPLVEVVYGLSRRVKALLDQQEDLLERLQV